MFSEDTPFIGVFIKRRESPRGPTVTYAEANVRPVEPIGAQDAPDPVRQSDFVSRAARWPKAIFTNIPGIQSVMNDEFGFPLFAPQPHAHFLVGPGPQLTWDERTNIQGGRSAPYGSSYEVVGGRGPEYAGVYAKILS
jgi:hypothetical protein